MRTVSQQSHLTVPDEGLNVSEKGRKRITEILEAARSVLINRGYAQFSLRNVAAVSGIHLGNLQYYFRTREDLIKGMIDYNALSYMKKFTELLDTLPQAPHPRFLAVVDYLIEDISEPSTRQFFIQFWALLDAFGSHSDRLLNEMYAPHLGTLSEFIAELNPSLSLGLRRQRAAIIASMIEGMMLMLEGADAQRSPGEASIKTEMRRQIVRIATDP